MPFDDFSKFPKICTMLNPLIHDESSQPRPITIPHAAAGGDSINWSPRPCRECLDRELTNACPAREDKRATSKL